MKLNRILRRPRSRIYTGILLLDIVYVSQASRLALSLRGATAAPREHFPSNPTTMYFEQPDTPGGAVAEASYGAPMAAPPSATVTGVDV